MRRLTRNG
jgi:hypothetical protein